MATTVTMPELAMRSLDAGWNRARWEQLPDDGNRYEVIDGVLYLTTAPSFFHQWIIRQIARALFTQIDDLGLGLTLLSPIGVFMHGCDPVQPDVFVVRAADLGIIHDRRVFGLPALIIEVLSPSNAEQDLETKRDAYAWAEVPEYWIVRPASRDLLLYSGPDGEAGVYRSCVTVTANADISSPTLPFRATIADFFKGAPDETI